MGTRLSAMRRNLLHAAPHNQHPYPIHKSISKPHYMAHVSLQQLTLLSLAIPYPIGHFDLQHFVSLLTQTPEMTRPGADAFAMITATKISKSEHSFQTAALVASVAWLVSSFCLGMKSSHVDGRLSRTTRSRKACAEQRKVFVVLLS